MNKVIHKNSDSSIEYNENGDATCFSGAEAVDLFRVATLSASMRLFKAGMKMKGLTGTQALQQAGVYTGKKYKRGQFDEARIDLKKLLVERRGKFQAETSGG